MIVSEELKKILSEKGIEPLDIVNLTTVNDKNKRTVTTTITLIDGSVHKLVDNYVWYAARKNKQW